MKAIGMAPAIIWGIGILFLMGMVSYSSLKRARQTMTDAGTTVADLLGGSNAEELEARARQAAQDPSLDEGRRQTLIAALREYLLAKRRYNATVAANPSRIIARLFGFKPAV